MPKFRHCILLVVFIVSMLGNERVKAAHIIGGDIYWECISDGPDAGKTVFYVSLYRDCSVNTFVTSEQEIRIINHPSLLILSIHLISQEDVSNSACGYTCESGQFGTVEKLTYASDPIAITGTPPAEGYRIEYAKCCRGQSDNITNGPNEEVYFSATMYPFEGREMYPCYDSSPAFAEKPAFAVCARSRYRYYSNALDPDMDSLSYELVPAIRTNQMPLNYESGFSGSSPLPGAAVNPSYADVVLNPSTGFLAYDFPIGLQGRWTVEVDVTAWRCGQRIARASRDMMITAGFCQVSNTAPVISEPNWLLPMGSTGYHVTVVAGDTVNFSVMAEDTNYISGVFQDMGFRAEGLQFGTGFTDANTGCLNAPCATLSGAVPPTIANGSALTTTFNWVTSCDHVVQQGECGTPSTTYNFLFKYVDDFCPFSASDAMNVSITVVADSVLNSPQPHCVSVLENGDLKLWWEPVSDPFSPSVFDAYIIEHAINADGPYQEVGSVEDINITEFVHDAANLVLAPSAIGPNHYRIRTRSGCDGRAVSAAVQTVSYIFLSVASVDTIVSLSWTTLADPPLASSNGNGQVLYMVYREYPAGNWQMIGTTLDTLFSDVRIDGPSATNYRIELSDALPCSSISNVDGYVFDGVSSVENLIGLHLQPNPNSGMFSVSTSSTVILGFRILDVSGRVLREEQLSRATDRMMIESDLPSGAYILHLNTERGVAMQKVTIMK